MEGSRRQLPLPRLTPSPVAGHNHLPPHFRRFCRACLSHSPRRQGPLSKSPHHSCRPVFTRPPMRLCGAWCSRNELPVRFSTDNNNLFGAHQLFEMDQAIFSLNFWFLLVELPPGTPRHSFRLSRLLHPQSFYQIFFFV